MSAHLVLYKFSLDRIFEDKFSEKGFESKLNKLNYFCKKAAQFLYENIFKCNKYCLNLRWIVLYCLCFLIEPSSSFMYFISALLLLNIYWKYVTKWIFFNKRRMTEGVSCHLSTHVCSGSPISFRDSHVIWHGQNENVDPFVKLASIIEKRPLNEFLLYSWRSTLTKHRHRGLINNPP